MRTSFLCNKSSAVFYIDVSKFPEKAASSPSSRLIRHPSASARKSKHGALEHVSLQANLMTDHPPAVIHCYRVPRDRQQKPYKRFAAVPTRTADETWRSTNIICVNNGHTCGYTSTRRGRHC